ncbi:hypothetical protein [Porphyrobacter sp. YT40]|uniref:hypothetical protein n=1 Tax=Porphyrobacter sp. YT40 TaxID=2547601 RepID=UPI001141D3AF|nr:hypothetical protein [Porphyrobacter sp. YT40]QDH35744.1 hypothetical protein E2E27_16345 [Porphyrobacter sp. YT40]
MEPATLPSVSLTCAALIATILAPAPAQGQGPEPAVMPRYLREIDRAVNAGDWTLQCDSGADCEIIGVVTPPRDHVGVRTVVMIGRKHPRGAPLSMRLAFLDSTGALAVHEPEGRWRLIPRGRLRGRAAVPLGLGPREADGAFRASPEAAAAIIAAVQTWPGAAIDNGERVIARMPRGNLGRLLARMERLQHPGKDPLTPAERAQWLREYHQVTLRGQAEEAPDMAPDAVENACSGRALPNRPFLFRIGPQHRMWIAECPEGNRIFLQPDNAEPVLFELSDNAGAVRQHDYAGFDGDSLLVLQLPDKERIDCGHWVKFGWTGSAFAMILHRRYKRCRMVPYDYWPRVWSPSSWRYAGQTPSDGGSGSVPGEGLHEP